MYELREILEYIYSDRRFRKAKAARGAKNPSGVVRGHLLLTSSTDGVPTRKPYM